MFGLAAVATGACAAPVFFKAAGEVHRALVLRSNVLARQGESVPAEAGAGRRLAQQRASGVSGSERRSEPGYMGKVPRKSMAGDLRKDYEVGGLGNATSSQGNITDILAKVPTQQLGTDQYKKINRSVPSRAPGFGNQSFPP